MSKYKAENYDLQLLLDAIQLRLDIAEMFGDEAEPISPEASAEEFRAILSEARKAVIE